ncbi:MAG: glycosyltransferase family 4 protein [Planctomycetota bacterium]|nr:glycosyltransferase family 4 protein [Planctomycetota bacterium]
MRIGIDGLHLFGPYSGVQNALARMLAAYAAEFPGDENVLYAPSDFAGPPDPAQQGLAVRKLWFPGRWRTVRTIWRNFRLQPRCYKDKCELLHGPTYALPSMLSLPSVLTVHDLIALSHPQFATPGSARVQKRMLPRSVKVARRVLVPTEAVKREVEQRLDVKPGRIDVVPWGVGEPFGFVHIPKRLEEARERWKLPKRYILYVGTIEPKKNIDGLIMSFFAAKMNKKLPHALVIAGRMGWGMEKLERLIREHNAREYILFTGYVPEEALPLLYTMADLCVLNSHIEGFGMPLLEAFACGCPAVIPDDPALVEVAGGAARVYTRSAEKPYQPLREMLEDLLMGGEAERKDLRRKGAERAKQFTWARTAQLTRESYEKALA